MPVKVPRFQVDRTLGSGSTGEVLHGRLLEDFADFPAGCEIAVKYLHASLTDKQQATRAFEREAQTALTVRNPGLVRAVARGEDERGPFIIMEYVPGQTLRALLEERGPLPEPTLRSVATQVAGGLRALHAAGYIHGDVKPENIRLDHDGRAVLVDLGFARRPGTGSRDALASPSLPASGSGSGTRAAGTLLYLAPERIRGEPGRAASDIFALGVVLYELATGQHPFSDRSPREFESGSDSRTDASSSRRLLSEKDVSQVIPRLLKGEMQSATTLDPILSPFLDAVFEACLSGNREDRPTAEELYGAFTSGEAGSWWRERVDFEAAARAASRDRHHFTPLVGRDRELLDLRKLANLSLDEAEARHANVVWLEGKLGSGKTRLARELVSRLRSRQEPPHFLYGRSWGTRENAPCQPLLRMLQRYLGLPRGGEPGDRDRAHLSTLVPPREVETLMSALDPHGLEATPVSVPAALSSWILALSRKHPVLMFLDDMHHADAETLRALVLIGDSLQDSRLFAVLAVGTDEPPRHPNRLQALRERLESHGGFRTLSLGELREGDVQELVQALFDHSSPLLRLGSTLWRQCHGHPGFLAELLRGMVSRGDMRPSEEEPGRFSLTVLPTELPQPANFQRAILDSFRALPEGHRAWLQRLSVIGRKIETEFVLAAFEHTSPAETDEILSELVRANWLVPHGKRFRFSRPASREMVYRTISGSRRKHLHAAAARALKPGAGAPIKIADAFQRAFHLRASEQYSELLLVLRPLLQRIRSRGMPQRVWRLSNWGLEALEALDGHEEHRELHLELLEHATDSADSLGLTSRQRDLLDRLADREGELGSGEHDPVQLGRIYLLHGRYAASTGQNGLARGWFRNAIGLFQEAGPSALLSESLRRLALVQALVGELDEAERLANEALENANRTGPGRGLARVVLATIYLLNDHLESALSEVGRAVYRLRQVKNRNVGGALAQAQILRARIYRSLGRPVRALGAASRSLQLARGCGERRLEAEAGARLGGLLLYMNRVEEAEARLREARLLAGEVEDKNEQALASVFLGVLLAESDRKEAGNRLQEATRLAGQAGLHRVEALSLAIEARLDLSNGRLQRAHTAATRATFLVERYGAELFDRVVIVGTASLIARELGQDSRAQALEKSLQRRLRRETARIDSDRLQRRHRLASTRLLQSVLSKDGPLYPRLRNLETN